MVVACRYLLEGRAQHLHLAVSFRNIFRCIRQFLAICHQIRFLPTSAKQSQGTLDMTQGTLDMTQFELSGCP
jgi:hypothetical protein